MNQFFPSMYRVAVIIITFAGISFLSKAQTSYLYSSNAISGDVSAYRIDGSSGVLAPVAGSPFFSGRQAVGIAGDAQSRFIFVTNAGSNSVSAFAIAAATGALIPAPGSPFVTGSAPNGVVVHPSGKFLYVANSNSNTISAYTIDQQTGALTPVTGSPFGGVSLPLFNLVIDKTGRFLYCPNVANGTVSGFSIDSSSGSLSAISGSPFATGTFQPNGVAIDPAGKFLYSDSASPSNSSLTKVGVFQIEQFTGGPFVAGLLSPIAGSPFSADGVNGRAILSEPTGNFVFVAEYISSTVSVFRRNQTDGSLSLAAGSPYPAGNQPAGLVSDPTGSFVYVANTNGQTGGGNISGYRIGSDGTLSNLTGSPFSSGQEPVALAISTPTVPSGLNVQFIFPSHGGNTGSVTIEIVGSGFQTGLTATLGRINAAIAATQVSFISSSVINATFDLTQATPGSQNVTVMNPDGTSVTTTGAFTIDQGGTSSVIANIIGRDKIRVGTPQTYYIEFSNDGNVDSPAALTSFSFPQGPIVSTATDNLETFNGGTSTVNGSTVLITAVNSIPPGGKALIPVTITVPSGTQSSAFSLSTFWNTPDGTPDTSQMTFDQYAGFLNVPFIPYNSACSTSLNSYADEALAYVSASEAYSDLTSLQLTKLRAQRDMTIEIGAFLLSMFNVENQVFKAFGVATIPEETAFGGAMEIARDAGLNAVKELTPDTASSIYFEEWQQDVSNAIGTIPGLKAAITISRPELATLFPPLDALSVTFNELGPIISAFFVARAPEQTAVNTLSTAFAKYALAEAAYKQYIAMNCAGTPPSQPPSSPGPSQTISLTPVQSLDPNMKTGPTGVGSSAYINSLGSIGYSIYFDNQPTATAPAQRVQVMDTLNANVDLNSVLLGAVTFPNQIVIPPAVPLSVAPYSATVDLRPGTNLLVNISASLNTASRVLIWTIQSIDPATNQPPVDPLSGFLPPGTEGSVLFTVIPKSTVATGFMLNNSATIIFDSNAPIATPTWSNTIDNSGPTSRISSLSASQSSYSFPVQWSGTDNGSGIRDFSIYVSDNGGGFTQWLANTTSTQGSFDGQPGHTYGFYSLSRDLVGNSEGSKASPEATTRVSSAITVPASLVAVTTSGLAYSRSTQTFSGTVAIKNIGVAPLYGPLQVVFTGLTTGVTLVSPSGTYNGNPYLSATAGSLLPGQTATATIQFRNSTSSAIKFIPIIFSGNFN